jgi:hypothetical protein
MTVNDLKSTLCASTDFWGGQEANSRANKLFGVPLVSISSLRLALYNSTPHRPTHPLFHST